MATAERSNSNKFHSKDDVVKVFRSIESTTSPITLGGIRFNTLTSDSARIPMKYRFHSNLKNHDNFFSKYISFSFHTSIYCTIVVFLFHMKSFKKRQPLSRLPYVLFTFLRLRINPQENNKCNDSKCCYKDDAVLSCCY